VFKILPISIFFKWLAPKATGVRSGGAKLSCSS